jgi:hypothetical protein
MTDYTGQKFGRLTAVEFAEMKLCWGGKHRSVWWFQCECGNKTKKDISKVKIGHTRSCGCLEQENLRALSRSRIKHGLAIGGSPHPIYQVWCGMKERCENPKSKCHHHYGGRGIKIEWACFEDFYRDMFPTYQAGLTIERKNNNGNYSKENCRWATRAEQSLNTRRNVIIEFGGESLPVVVWAQRIGLKASVIAYRIREGWSAARALTQPVNGSKPSV